MDATQNASGPDSNQLIDLLEARQLAASGEAFAIRAACGLSLRDVAGAIASTAATVMRWERGTSTPYGPAARHYGKLLAALRDHLDESSPPSATASSTKTTDAGGRRVPV